MKNLAMLQPPEQPIVRHVDREQCLVWFGNVSIIFSTKPPGRVFMHRIIDELFALEAARQCGVGALLVIRSDVDPPSEEAREYIRDELRRSGMRVAAQVVEGEGFRGAAMRSVLTMLQFAIRTPYPMKIFDGVSPGATWLTNELHKRVGEAPNAARLTEAALSLRRRFLTQSLPPPAMSR